MEDIIVQLLAAVGGIGVILFGISRLSSGIFQNYLMERSRRATEQSLEYQRHRLGSQRVRTDRFASMQFESYHALWTALHSLGQVGEALWEAVTPENLSSFAEQLRETKRIVGDGAIFFEDIEYNELERLLNAFSDYQVGKTRLYEIRSKRELDEWSLEEAQRQIDENQEHRQQYQGLLNQIRESFRNRLSSLSQVPVR